MKGAMAYQSEIGNILDWVERGCVRLMRSGGGPLIHEIEDPQRRKHCVPITDKEKEQMFAMMAENKSLRAIAAAVHRPYNSVARITRLYRLERGMTERRTA